MNKTKRYQKIKIEKLETASSKLEQLESKPQSELRKRESIYYLRNQLKNALKKGYSYEDLSDILAEQDILVSPATLKQHLNDIYNKSASNKKKNQPSLKKASPKITPHELIESARDLSNTTAMQGEKIELEKTLNSTSTAEETDRSNPDVAAVYKELCQFTVLSEDEKTCRRYRSALRDSDRSTSNWLSTVSSPSSNESLD